MVFSNFPRRQGRRSSLSNAPIQRGTPTICENEPIGRMQRRSSLGNAPVVRRRASLNNASVQRRASLTHAPPMLSWFSGSEHPIEKTDECVHNEIPSSHTKTSGLHSSPMTSAGDSCESPRRVEKVQIMGLELLKARASYAEGDEESSYESYANDSFPLAESRMSLAVSTLRTPPPRRLSSEHRPRRRLSNCSSHVGETDAKAFYDYGSTHNTRDLGYSSLHVPRGGSSHDVDYGRFKTTRRGSMESYANDSVDYGRYKTTRRSSIDSYANDSVEFRRFNVKRQSSAQSFAADSVGNNRYRSISRRSSTGSHSINMHSIRARVPRRFSNMSDYGSESLDISRKDGDSLAQYSFKRRMSNASNSSYSSRLSGARFYGVTRAA